MKHTSFFLALIFLFAVSADAQLDYAKQMAATIMAQYKDSMVVKRYASHLVAKVH